MNKTLKKYLLCKGQKPTKKLLTLKFTTLNLTLKNKTI